MNKRILILKGSPRPTGNSSVLADQVEAGAKSANAHVESFDLFKMNINPCDGCDNCQGKNNQGCVINDDMQLLYARLREADAIVLASPVYWFTMSAQLKLCIDRWYALVNAEGCELKGKRIGIVLTYGDSDPFTSGGINAIRTFQDIFRFIKADIVGFVYGTAMNIGDIDNQPNLLEKAFKLGQKLAK
jgi:multimeric flavodoxin WrbA